MSSWSELQKRRMIWMLAINGLATIVGITAFVAYWLHTREWLLLVFIGAITTGVVAQIWFIMGLRVQGDAAAPTLREPRASRGA